MASLPRQRGDPLGNTRPLHARSPGTETSLRPQQPATSVREGLCQCPCPSSPTRDAQRRSE